MHNGVLYAIHDKKADLIIGNIQLHHNDAVATRQFSDVCAAGDNIISKHPEDFQLLSLGHLTQDNRIEPHYEVVLTGSQWAALNKQEK